MNAPRTPPPCLVDGTVTYYNGMPDTLANNDWITEKDAAPFPPTPCRVYGTPAVDEDRELLVDVIERAYPSVANATLVPRAQWEAVEAFIVAEYARRRAYKKWLHGGTEYISDLQTTDRFEREALDALLTFFPEATNDQPV